MGAAWIRHSPAAVALLVIVGLCRADEPPPPSSDAVKLGTATPPASIEATSSSDPPTTAPRTADLARAQALERLKTLSKLDGKSPATNALTKLLEERCGRLDELQNAVKERQALESPSPAPEQQAAEWRAELGRVQALLDRGAKEPDLFLPASIRKGASAEAPQAELTEAIDAAKAEWKEWSAKLEQWNADPLRNEGAALAPTRSARDKVFKRLTLLKSQDTRGDAGPAKAKTPEDRELARETGVNHDWDVRVEAERLRVEEARLALETRRAEYAPLNKKVLEAHVRLAQAALDRLKARYADLAAHREKELRARAEKEEKRARLANDPLERYRAKRAAELLDEQARVVRSANALATDPSPSLEEQRGLADRALADFTNVKHLVDDGRVSHLDALRLTNDFRRIGVDRARIVANELTVSAARLTAAENALSEVELELMYDRRDDRYELDGLLERLPKSRHAEAVALFEGLEKTHFELLKARGDALDKLASRAQETHDQVLRRLQILDDHFGFIRTHIFWVRDEEPVNGATLAQARRELTQLGRSSLRMASEVVDPSYWGRVSAEFVVAGFGLVVLPWPLHRVRRVLRPGPTEVPPIQGDHTDENPA